MPRVCLFDVVVDVVNEAGRLDPGLLLHPEYVHAAVEVVASEAVRPAAAAENKEKKRRRRKTRWSF